MTCVFTYKGNEYVGEDAFKAVLKNLPTREIAPFLDAEIGRRAAELDGAKLEQEAARFALTSLALEDVRTRSEAYVAADARRNEAELRLREAEIAYSRASQTRGVPDMPFKSTWPALVMKRIIRWGVDHGFDKIAWTTGAEQSERYNLSEVIPALRVTKRVDGRYEVGTNNNRANSMIVEQTGAEWRDGDSSYMTAEQMKEAFGQDLSARAISRADAAIDEDGYGQTVVLESDDLKIGSEGMRQFYDRNLVNIANDLIKKYGGKVEPITMKDRLKAGANLGAFRDTGALLDAYENGLRTKDTINPGFTITPELAEAARSGLPLFQNAKGKPVSAADAAAIAERLHTELDALGISDRIALKVANGLLTDKGAQGSYFRRVIQVSLDMATNPSATLGHEAIHAMRALGLFTDSEWSALTKAAKADAEIAAIVRKEYTRLSPEKQDEEAAAEFFSRWRDERMQAKGFAAKAFQRLLDFMGALGRAVAWIKGDRSVKAGTVMRGIESGKIGRRETNAGAFEGQERPQFQKITRNAFPDANIEAAYLMEREFGPPTPRGMKPADYDLFARKLLLDDLQWEALAGANLPYGFTDESLTAAKVKIDRLTDANQGVREAVRRYKFAELLAETAANVTPESITQAERNEPAEGAPPRAANIRLDKLESADDIKAALESVATDFAGFGDARRGVVSHEETQRLASDLDMTVDQLMTRRKGQAFNAHEMFAAREMLLASADNLVALAKKAEGGSDQDLVNFRKAWVRHVAIQEQVSGLTAEAGRALNQFKMMAKAGGDLNARMLREIIDIEGGRGDVENVAKAIMGFADDPAKMNRFARDAFKPTWRDKLFELWINGLLSGPATHVVNAISNTMTALTQIPEFAAAATIGKVRSKFRPDTDRILRSEVGARAIGLIHGAKEGAKLAAAALRSGEGSDVLSKMEARTQRAISGVKGEIVRIPGRLLIASDELYKGIARRSDLAAQAAHIATKEGLRGDEFKARTAELLANPTDEMIDKANDYARYSTFQRPLGPTGQAITRVINLVPGLRLIVPFIRTPANIFKFTIARTLAAPIMKEIRDEIKAGGSQRDLAIARMMLGTGLMATVMQLAAAGIITGGEPDDDDARRLLRATGWQPYSIKIGSTYYSYQRLDPLATLLGLAADLNGNHENMSEAERANASTTMFHSMLNQLKNKTFLSGIGNLIEAVEDPERFGPSFIGRLAGSVVPAFIAQGNNAYGDTTQRDARSILERVEARIPGLSNTLPARRDIWGREMVREGGVGPDIASPFWTSEDRQDSVTEELLRTGVNLNVPSRRVGDAELSADDYDRYQSVAGQRLRTAAERLISSGAWQRANVERRVELFDTLKNRVRREARQSLGLSHR